MIATSGIAIGEATMDAEDREYRMKKAAMKADEMMKKKAAMKAMKAMRHHDGDERIKAAMKAMYSEEEEDSHVQNC